MGALIRGGAYLKKALISGNTVSQTLKPLLAQTYKRYDIIKNTEEWQNYDPPTIPQNNQEKLLWDFTIQADHVINHNKPDIMLHNKNRNTYRQKCGRKTSRKKMESSYVNLSIGIKTLLNVNKVMLMRKESFILKTIIQK